MIFLYLNPRDRCFSPNNSVRGPSSLHPSDLLVEDHVNSVGFDVNGVFPHKLQDIFNSCGVREAAQANAVAGSAGCWKEGRRGEDWD